jgi:hypothetical protein
VGVIPVGTSKQKGRLPKEAPQNRKPTNHLSIFDKKKKIREGKDEVKMKDKSIPL